MDLTNYWLFWPIPWFFGALDQGIGHFWKNGPRIGHFLEKNTLAAGKGPILVKNDPILGDFFSLVQSWPTLSNLGRIFFLSNLGRFFFFFFGVI